MIKVNDVGLVDFMFDLVFRFKVNDDEMIVWCVELKWIVEVGKVVLFYILDENLEMEIILVEIIKFEGVFIVFFNF